MSYMRICSRKLALSVKYIANISPCLEHRNSDIQIRYPRYALILGKCSAKCLYETMFAQLCEIQEISIQYAYLFTNTINIELIFTRDLFIV